MTETQGASPGYDPTGYDAVVFDLDGTLVRLVVDWDAVEAELRAALADVGVDPGERTAWELLDAAEAAGRYDELAAIVAEHERRGAEQSRQLALADDLLAADVPIAVCSLNCEAACRIALSRHDLLDAVTAVVGRDTVEERKPHPEPLLTAVEALDVAPERTLFVGDSESDAICADRAGTDFSYVLDGPSTL